MTVSVAWPGISISFAGAELVAVQASMAASR